MTELEAKLIERAERIDEKSDGKYLILPARALTADEFAELIMGEVQKLQGNA